MRFQDLPSSTREAFNESKRFAEHFYGGRDEPAGPAFLLPKQKNGKFQVVMLEPDIIKKISQNATGFRNQYPASHYTLGSLVKGQIEETPGETEAVLHALKYGTVKNIAEVPGAELMLVVEHQTPSLSTRGYYKYLGDDKFADTPMIVNQWAPSERENLMGIRFFPK